MSENFGLLALTVHVRALRDVLSRLKKSVLRDGGRPVYSQVRLSMDLMTDAVHVAVVNVDWWHSIRLSVAGAALLPDTSMNFERLLKFLLALPEDGTLTLRGEVGDAQVLGTCGSKTFRITREDVSAWPETPEPHEGHKTYKAELGELLAPVLSCVATDESRYGLNGACVEIYADGGFGAASTDGHRACVHRLRREEQCTDSLLLGRGLSRLVADQCHGETSVQAWSVLPPVSSWRSWVEECVYNGDSTISYTVGFVVADVLVGVLTRGWQRFGARQTHCQTFAEDAHRLQTTRRDTLDCVVSMTRADSDAFLAGTLSAAEFEARAQITGKKPTAFQHLGQQRKLSHTFVGIDCGDTRLVARTLEGDFPDIRQILQHQARKACVVSSDALTSAARYCLAGRDSDKVKAVLLRVSEGTLHMRSGRAHKSEAYVSDDVSVTTEHNFHFGVDAEYLIDAVKTVTGAIPATELKKQGKKITPDVQIGYHGHLAPIYVSVPGRDHLYHVIMPMRLDAEGVWEEP